MADLEVIIRMDGEERVFRATDKAGKGMEKFKKKTTSADKSMQRMVKTVKRLAVAFGGLRILAQVTRWLGSAIKATAEFDKGLAEVGTLTKFTAKQMAGFRKETLAMSVAFNQTTKSLNVARYNLVSAGIKDTAKQTEFLTAANKAAIAAVTDVNSIIGVATAVINAFGEETINVTEATNIMQGTINAGTINMEQLKAGIGDVLTPAKLAGQNFRTVGASLAFLTSQGLPPAIAMTKLKNVFTELSAVTSKQEKMLKKQGVTLRDSTGKFLRFDKIIGQLAKVKPDTIRKLFPSKESQTAIFTATQSLEKFKEKFKALEPEATATAVDDAFALMAETVSFKMGQIGQAWGGFWKEAIGGSESEELKEALGLILELIEDNKKEIEELAKLFGDTLGKAIKGAITAFKDWQALLDASAGDQGIRRLRKEFAMFVEDFVKGNDAMSQAARKFVDGYISDLSRMVFGSDTALKNLGLSFDNFAKLIKWAMSSVFKAITTPIRNAIKLVTGMFNLMVKVVGATVGKIAPTVGRALGKAIDAVASVAKSMYRAGQAFIQQLIDGAKSKGEELYNYVAGLARRVGRLWPFSPAKEGPLVNLRDGGAGIVTELAAGVASNDALMRAVDAQASQAMDRLSDMTGGGDFSAAADAARSSALQPGGNLEGFAQGGFEQAGIDADRAQLIRDTNNQIELDRMAHLEKMEAIEQAAHEKALEQMFSNFEELMLFEIEKREEQEFNRDLFLGRALEQELDFWGDMGKAANQAITQTISRSYMIMADAFARLVAGQKLGGKEMVKALLDMTAGIILGIGQQAAIKGVFALAEGLFFKDPTAIAASKLYFAVAAMALVAGGALKAASGGGGSGGGDSAGGGISGGGSRGGGDIAGDEGGGGDFIINVNVDGDVIDVEEFVENKIIPALAEGIDRGVLLSGRININTSRD